MLWTSLLEFESLRASVQIITYYCVNCGHEDRPYMDFWTELCSLCGAEGPEVIKENVQDISSGYR